MIVFWVNALYSLVETDQRFRGLYCLHHQGEFWNGPTYIYSIFARGLLIALFATSETSVSLYVTTWRCQRENLKYRQYLF
jgi:hypothetical protein